ncbi:MAG TPA: hypothetical protein VK923_01115 [Euzebyales bacterium]|nr:hypothetical protein [Euzebyales bacterium]
MRTAVDGDDAAVERVDESVAVAYEHDQFGLRVPSRSAAATDRGRQRQDLAIVHVDG